MFGVASLLLSTSFAVAEDTNEDAYEKAYTKCDEKAEASQGDYDQAFSACMKEKGFSVEGEADHIDGDDSAGGSSSEDN